MGNYRLGMETNAGYGTYLAHHGIKGQKWGVRRFQNPDGTLTEEGKRRYLDSTTGEANHKKIHDAYSRDNSGDNPVKRRADQKHIDMLDAIRGQASDLSGFTDSISTYNKALLARNKNKNPFKSKKLYTELENARENNTKNVEKYMKMYSDMAMDYIDSMPKDQREDAMRYVGLMLYY